jgi:hypothetical protein
MTGKLWLYCIVLFIVWIIFCCIAILCFSGIFNCKYEAVFIASGALSTALAFGATYYAIRKQQKDTLRTTTLEVYINIFDKMLQDESLKRAQQYVKNDLSSDIKQFIKESKGIDIDMDNKAEVSQYVSEIIEELKKIKNKKSNTKNKDGFDNVITASYESKFDYIDKVCNKIEYIGVLVKHGYIDIDFIIDYWDEIISKTYEKLEPFIDSERQRNACMYFHYQYLYEQTLSKRDHYEQKKKNSIKQFDMDKLKREEDKLKREIEKLKQQRKLINKQS